MSKVKSIKVKMQPTSVIETKLGIQKDGPIHKFFTNSCAKAMDKYVPASQDENLAKSVKVSTDEIIYPGPYAHYLWEGRVMGPNIPVFDKNGNIVRWWSKAPKYYTGKDIVFSTEVHPLATSHWDKKMWTAEREKIEKDVLAEIRKRGGK